VGIVSRVDVQSCSGWQSVEIENWEKQANPDWKWSLNYVCGVVTMSVCLSAKWNILQVIHYTKFRGTIGSNWDTEFFSAYHDLW